MRTVLAAIPKKPGKYVHTVTVDLGGRDTLAIPVHVALGSTPGPVLVMAAGEHGTEVNGIAAVDRVFREIPCADLRGTVMAVPAINTRNVQTRLFPQDGDWDTCYKWPGDLEGTPAERITATLAATVMNDADMVINLHAWSWYSSSCAFTWRRDPLAVRLMRGFGLPFVDCSFGKYCDGRKSSLHPRHNLLTHYVMSRGKSAMLVELRTHHWQFPESVLAGIRGLRNVMISMEMLPGTVSLPEVQLESSGPEELVYAAHSGLYVPVREIADRVKKGETLGYLLDLQTGRRKAVKSPCAGGVWLNARVGKGESGLADMHSFADEGDLLALIKHLKP
jgi:predicted deacylase